VKYFLFVLIALFWGGSFIAIKDLVADVPPLMAATLRQAAAIIFLAVFYAVKKKKFFVQRRLLWKVWLTGLFMLGIPFSLLFWGEQKISAGLAGILNGCTPVCTFILSLIFLTDSETFSVSKLVGLIISIAGMVLIFSTKLQLTGRHDELLGSAAVFAMAVSYAIGTILARRNFAGRDKIDMYAGLFQQLLASFVYLAILSFLFEDWHSKFSHVMHISPILDILYLGWVSTAIAFMFFYYLMSQWGPIRTSAVTYTVPMAALLFDYLFNKKIPLFSDFLGALIVLTGICIIQISSYLNDRRSQNAT
jgi:drug/metabolite transporter (DMT)-like permease